MRELEARHVIYIAAAPRRVWQALTDGVVTAVWFGERFESAWKPGAAFRSFAADGRVAAEGRVVESDAPRVLALTRERALSRSGEMREVPRAVATIVVGPVGADVVRLTATEQHDAPADPDDVADGASAWPIALSRLKTLLETGRTMPRFPGE